MQALILAGGRGMSLAPLTHDLPVPLLYLPGGTLLDYLLARLAACGIEQVALVLQYQGDQIARHVVEQVARDAHVQVCRPGGDRYTGGVPGEGVALPSFEGTAVRGMAASAIASTRPCSGTPRRSSGPG